jgi:hypothetical protein
MPVEVLRAHPSVRVWSDAVCKETASSIYGVYTEAMAQATASQLAASAILPADLIACASEDSARFIRFSAAVVRYSRGAPLDQAHGPCASGEPVWQTRQFVGLIQDFVVPHLIAYHFARRAPEGLAPYLKATRTPKPTALAGDLCALYAAVAAVA